MCNGFTLIPQRPQSCSNVLKDASSCFPIPGHQDRVFPNRACSCPPTHSSLSRAHSRYALWLVLSKLCRVEAFVLKGLGTYMSMGGPHLYSLMKSSLEP